MNFSKKKIKLWDVVVIGGGAAGMMAAGRAAELGRSVLLLEKNSKLGKKLLITGGGRCNLTNNKPVVRNLIEKFKGNNKFLFTAFSQFAVNETLEFFNNRGLAIKQEAEDRIFPQSNKAQSVWNLLVDYIKKNNVEVYTNTDIVKISKDPETNFIYISSKNKMEVLARSCIVAMGGTSHPETGSNGDGYKILKKLGHTIVQNNFALVPIAVKDDWAKKLGGVSLKDIKLTSYADGKRHEIQKGKMLFTHFGISGPAVLNLSKGVGDLLQYGEVVIFLDFFPHCDSVVLKKQLYELLATENNKKLKNTLNRLVPTALVETLLELAKVDGEIVNNNLIREDRMKLLAIMKNLPLHVESLLGSDKAVVSSGGVLPQEVDFKTMRSRIIPNLFIVGDLLNIDRPSGGYSLQLCWTTGFVAGSNA